MPVHDWTLVNAGTFHAFHTAWMGEFQRALNGGLLPAERLLKSQLSSRPIRRVAPRRFWSLSP